MAIFKDIPGIVVTVAVNGVEVHEYEEEVEVAEASEIEQFQNSVTVQSYIEVIPSQEFILEISIDKGYKFQSSCLGVIVKVDGVLVARKIAHKVVHEERLQGSYVCVSGVKIGKTGLGRLRPFVFSKIKTVTDKARLGNIKEEVEHVGRLGSIEVWLYEKSDQKRSQTPQIFATELGSNNDVHIKAVRAHSSNITHATSLGQSKPTDINLGWTSDYVHGKDYPIAIYKFKYRTEDALKRLGILESTPGHEIEPAPAPAFVLPIRPNLDLGRQQGAEVNQNDVGALAVQENSGHAGVAIPGLFLNLELRQRSPGSDGIEMAASNNDTNKRSGDVFDGLVIRKRPRT